MGCLVNGEFPPSAPSSSGPSSGRAPMAPSPVGLGAPPVPTRGAPGAVRGTGCSRRLHDSPNRRQTTSTSRRTPSATSRPHSHGTTHKTCRHSAISSRYPTSNRTLPTRTNIAHQDQHRRIQGRLRDRVGGMNAGRPRLPEQRPVAISRRRPDGMILVTVSCATEAIRRKGSHDIRGRFGP